MSNKTIFKDIGVNNLIKYNNKSNNKLGRIVFMFDEFADWMLDDEFKRSASDLIQRLYPAIFYMMESLNKRYFKTSEEGNI